MSTTFDHRGGSVLDVEGAQIYYELAGRKEGDTLLMLHGGLGHIEDLNSILPAVAHEYRVIGIDSRGHGRSTLGQAPLTYELLHADVERVLAHLGIGTVSIIGFSDGGVLGYRLAARSGPGSVNVAKLVTIGATWRLEQGDLVVSMLAGITADWWKDKFPESYATYHRLNPKPDFDRFASSVVEMWLDTSSSGYPAMAVKDITCPTLVVRGQQDHLFPLEEAEELVGLIKPSHLLNILSAGHAAFDDRKELFCGALVEFLCDEPTMHRSGDEAIGKVGRRVAGSRELGYDVSPASSLPLQRTSFCTTIRMNQYPPGAFIADVIRRLPVPGPDSWPQTVDTDGGRLWGRYRVTFVA